MVKKWRKDHFEKMNRHAAEHPELNGKTLAMSMARIQLRPAVVKKVKGGPGGLCLTYGAPAPTPTKPKLAKPKLGEGRSDFTHGGKYDLTPSVVDPLVPPPGKKDRTAATNIVEVKPCLPDKVDHITQLWEIEQATGAIMEMGGGHRCLTRSSDCFSPKPAKITLEKC